MPGPLEGYRLIHNAILKEARDFEQLAEDLNWEDRARVSETAERFAFYHGVLLEHEESEDRTMFPLAEQRFRYVSDTYVYDHQGHQALYDEIEALLRSLTAPAGSRDASDTAKQLRRKAIILRALMDNHISKENDLLIPVFEEHVDLAELARMEEEAMKDIPPQRMGEMVVWMFPRQPVEGREEFLSLLKMMMPPEAFKGLAQMLSGTIPADDWRSLESRIPDLRA